MKSNLPDLMSSVRRHLERLSQIRRRGAGVLYESEVVACLEDPFLAARLAVDLAMREGRLVALFVTETTQVHRNPAFLRELINLTEGNRFQMHSGREAGGFYAWRMRFLPEEPKARRELRFSGLPTAEEQRRSTDKALAVAAESRGIFRRLFGKGEPEPLDEENPF